jgi:Heterokaryon incompatibility protein (HET)
MGLIYGKSERTIVWPGEEDQSMQLASEVIRSISSPGTDSKQDVQTVRQLLEKSATSMSEKRQASLTALLNREWFTRSWVFQEAVLPRNLLIKCGTFEVTMENLTRSVNAVETVLDQDRGYAHSFRKLTVGTTHWNSSAMHVSLAMSPAMKFSSNRLASFKYYSNVCYDSVPRTSVIWYMLFSIPGSNH